MQYLIISYVNVLWLFITICRFYKVCHDRIKHWDDSSSFSFFPAPCVPVIAMLLRRARLSSWLSWRCSLDFVAAVAAGDRSGLLSFLKRRGGGAANSFWREAENGERKRTRRLIRLCSVIFNHIPTLFANDMSSRPDIKTDTCQSKNSKNQQGKGRPGGLISFSLSTVYCCAQSKVPEHD